MGRLFGLGAMMMMSSAPSGIQTSPSNIRAPLLRGHPPWWQITLAVVVLAGLLVVVAALWRRAARR